MAGHYTRQANRELLAKRATERTNKAHASPHHDEPAPLKKISKISDLLCLPFRGMAGEEGLNPQPPVLETVKTPGQSGSLPEITPRKTPTKTCIPPIYRALS